MSGSMWYADGGDVDEDEDDKEKNSPLDLSDEDKSAVSNYIDPQGPSRDRQAQLDALQRLRDKPIVTPDQLNAYAPGIIGPEAALEETAAPFVQEAIPAVKEAVEQAVPEIKNALPTLADKLKSLLENPNQTVELQGSSPNSINMAKWLKLKELLGLKGTTVVPK